MKKALITVAVLLCASLAQASVQGTASSANPWFRDLASRAAERIVPEGVASIINGPASETKALDSEEVAPLAAVLPGVPEPETYAMMVAGLVAVGFIARRQQKRRG
jgi:hypothetical protein